MDESITSRQGGDLRGLRGRHDVLDLSSCVNRYGPPPSVAEALGSVDTRTLREHPYSAERDFISAYAEFLGVEGSLLIPGRGITEFIRALGYVLPEDKAVVLTPDYTDTLRTFPIHYPQAGEGIETPDERLKRAAQAMSKFRFVFLSNPNNPLGIYIHRDELTAVCRRYPESCLIVDEAYMDFIENHNQLSMIHTDVTNLAVLRSPNKILGLAGTRTGAMYTRNPALFRAVMERKINWTISQLDLIAVMAALREGAWIRQTRTQLLETAAAMENILKKRHPQTVTGVPVHYRFVPAEDSVAVYRHLLSLGVVVRAFASGELGRIPGIRITAPTRTELGVVEHALLNYVTPSGGR